MMVLAASPRVPTVMPYYWRVDEVNGPPDFTVFEGKVWSFTTELFAYPIDGNNITATASSSNVGKGPENTINGSGLDNSGLLHGKDAEDNMWLSTIIGPQPTWIEFQFDEIYRLHELWVWNSNDSLETAIGLGFKDVSIEYSVNGTDYTALGTTHEFARAPGAPDYAHNTTVDLSGIAAKYVRLTAKSNWGGILSQYGLSEVRFFYIPVHAREPSPVDGQTDVSIGTIDEPADVTLGFRPGREAATHDVYFGIDEQAVIDGTAAVTTVTEASHGPLSLDLGKTYYWRVDEVNEAESPATWQGKLWDFTTQEYFVVDDIESYNDLDPGDPNSNRIFLKWLDGYGVATNGSVVGYENPPFCEQTIIHSGEQSMPLAYDNSGTARYSEATLTLSSGRNWTVRGAGALSLWFKGNRVAFIEEPPGTFTVNASGVDIWDTSDEFRYVWKQLSGDGEIIAQVLSVEQTDDWAKAGVMIRDTLDADSPNVFVAITGGGGDGATFQRRTAPGGTSSSSRTLVGISPPASVKLVRKGILFTGYVFLDGQWQQEGQLVAVQMTDPVYIGLAVTSHAAGVTCEAVFSDIQINGAVSGQFTEQAIGVDMPSNSPAPMYVALADSGGTPVTVYHDDPSALQISDWTQWLINLKQFGDGGVNLTNVNTISIGFGDKANPQPGGSGMMLFDDIRLYPLP
ncbi:MAG: discoidin domain-containing protein [Planctomycetota bacterium]